MEFLQGAADGLLKNIGTKMKRSKAQSISLNLCLASESVPSDPSSVLAFVQQRGETCNGYDWTLAHYIKRKWLFCDRSLDPKRITIFFWIDLPKAGSILASCKSPKPTGLLVALRRLFSATFFETNICRPTPQARQSLSFFLACLTEDCGRLIEPVSVKDHPCPEGREKSPGLPRGRLLAWKRSYPV